MELVNLKKIKVISLLHMVAKQIPLTLLLFSLNSCQNFVFEKDLNKLLGVTNVVVEQREIVEEVGGIHGEGYTIEVYKLSEKTIEHFNKKTDKILPTHEDSNAWKKIGWLPTPIETSYSEVTSIITDYVASEEKLKARIDTIKKAIKTRGN